MKTLKSEMALYAVISFVAVAFVIAMDVTFYAYKNFHFFPKLAITLYVVTPIFVAILSYIKILMQKRMPLRFSRITNIAVVLLLLIGMIVLYPLFLNLILFGTMAFIPPMGLLALVTRNIMTTFFFCLQVCALVYDFFFRKKEKACCKSRPGAGEMEIFEQNLL